VSTSKYPSKWSEERLGELLFRSRIDAEPSAIDNSEGRPIRDIIHEESRSSDIVFMGLREPDLGGEAEYASRLEGLIGELPTVVLVRAAGPFAGLLLEPSDPVVDQEATAIPQ
jgi:hypothetical protein